MHFGLNTLFLFVRCSRFCLHIASCIGSVVSVLFKNMCWLTVQSCFCLLVSFHFVLVVAPPINFSTVAELPCGLLVVCYSHTRLVPIPTRCLR